ncbi:sel1 repeat family protein [Pseudoalteromonas shioyasakiensis]|uniref:tetratricopeptide repeat protein n=1 Tax=Pseudoalteromonas shioyasakiensis TaxID=1190813 RepID=UPI0021199BBC|nr:tetratricopeptide repeat protein [Pseudoalteromonas shioyasakiensis]MCQ8877116.1 sel1 repeat family protein [Pseudoalteromonas shioyasakiensis]
MKIIKIFLTLAFLFFTSLSTHAYQITQCSTEDCVDRFKDFKKYARKDIPQATEVLGTFYYKGYGVEQSFKKARKYYLNSAKYGNPNAQFKLALMMLEGKGGDKEISQGINWMEWAARNDILAAHYFLGLYYLEGEYVDKDVELGKQFLKYAATKEYRKAQYILGKLYESDVFGKPNKDIAVEYYKMSAYFYEPSNDRLLELGIKLPQTNKDGNIERIEVESESLDDYFDTLLSALRYMPAPGKPTGSNLVGMGCRSQDSNCGFIVDPAEIERFMRDMQVQFVDPILTRHMRPLDL